MRGCGGGGTGHGHTLPICEQQLAWYGRHVDPEVHVAPVLVWQVWGGSPEAACGPRSGGRRVASRRDGNGPEEGGRCFVMRRERCVTDTGAETL